ncbi:MAG: DUF4878 domain-containing protein [Bacteroidia bacterium]|nr:DUF4878 domain-containing protein [Bacteroidia bacterium]
MKTIRDLSLIILTSGLLFSCSKQSKPEDVAIAFQTAILKLDFQKAGELGTDKTKEYMKTMQGFATMMGDAKFKEEKEKAEKTKIEVVDCQCVEIDANKQKCTVTIKNEEKTDESSPVILSKVDGKWLVDMSKEDAGLNSKENSSGETQEPGIEEEDNSNMIEDLNDSADISTEE